MRKRTNFQVRSDAAKQRWVRDDKKEAFWRKHIEAWKKSRLSKRAYCISHDLSQSSFGAWFREIELRDRERLPSANAADLLSDPDVKPDNPFVPLRLLPDELTEKKPEPAEGNLHQGHIEILVPGGVVIRLNERCGVNFVAELLHSLKG